MTGRVGSVSTSGTEITSCRLRYSMSGGRKDVYSLDTLDDVSDACSWLEEFDGIIILSCCFSFDSLKACLVLMLGFANPSSKSIWKNEVGSGRGFSIYSAPG